MELFPKRRSRSSSLPTPSTLPLPALDVYLRPRSAPANLPRLCAEQSRSGLRSGRDRTRPKSSSATCRQASKSSTDSSTSMADRLRLEAPKDLTRLLRSFFATHLATDKRLDIDPFVKAQAALTRAMGQKFKGEAKESAASGFFELQTAAAGGKDRFEAFCEWQVRCFFSLGMNWKEMVWLLNQALAQEVCDVAGMLKPAPILPIREQRRQCERIVAKRQEKERITHEIHLAQRKEFQQEVDRNAEKAHKRRTDIILKEMQKNERIYHRKKEIGLRLVTA